MALERSRLLHCPVCFEVMILRDSEGDVWECPECGSMLKGPGTDFRTVGQLWHDEQRVKRAQAKPGGGQRKRRKRSGQKRQGSPAVVMDDPEFNRRHLQRLLEDGEERRRILDGPGASMVPPEYIFPRGFLQYGRDEIEALRVDLPEAKKEAKCDGNGEG